MNSKSKNHSANRPISQENENGAADRIAETVREASSLRNRNDALPAEIVFEPTPRENWDAFQFSSSDAQKIAADRTACERALLQPKRARRSFWNLPAKRAAQTPNFRRDSNRFDRRPKNDEFNDCDDFRGGGIA